MPYIADYLWQDVLAAAKVAISHLKSDGDDRVAHMIVVELETAVEAAEGGSSTEGEVS